MNNKTKESYTAKRGDSLWSISKTFNIPISELIQANPGIKDPSRLNPGDVLNIPSGSTQLPCSVILRPIRELPPDSIGTALVRKLVDLDPAERQLVY